MTVDLDRLRARLSEFLPGSDVATAVALARRAALLLADDPARPAGEAAQAGPHVSAEQAKPSVGSQLGGLPRLPVDVPWPEGRDGPLRLLAQIDLAELAPVGLSEPLPTAGLLTVIGPTDMPAAWSAETAEAYRVLIVPAENSVVTQPPRGVGVTPYLAVRPFPVWTLPSLAENLVLPRDDDAWAEAVSALDIAPRHRVGGWPHGGAGPTESAFEVVGDGAAERYRLLVQLDADGRLGWSWGGGALCFCIQEEDLRAGAWKRARTVMLQG